MIHITRIRTALAALVLGSAVALPLSHGMAPQSAHAAAKTVFPLQGVWITPAPDSAAITPVIVSAQFVASGAPDGPLRVKYTIQAFRNGQNLGQQVVIANAGTSTVTVTLYPPCASGAKICIVRGSTWMTLSRSGADVQLTAIAHTLPTIGFPTPDISYAETLIHATL